MPEEQHASGDCAAGDATLARRTSQDTLSVDILGYRFTVAPEAKLEIGGLLGACAVRERQILFNPAVMGRQLADTVLHEVLHAISEITLAKEVGLNELQVNAVSAALIDVLCRNPRLVDFLLAHGTEGTAPESDPA